MKWHISAMINKYFFSSHCFFFVCLFVFKNIFNSKQWQQFSCLVIGSSGLGCPIPERLLMSLTVKPHEFHMFANMSTTCTNIFICNFVCDSHENPVSYTWIRKHFKCLHMWFTSSCTLMCLNVWWLEAVGIKSDCPVSICLDQGCCDYTWIRSE